MVNGVNILDKCKHYQKTKNAGLSFDLKKNTFKENYKIHICELQWMRNAFFSSFILFYFFLDKLAAQGEGRVEPVITPSRSAPWGLWRRKAI